MKAVLRIVVILGLSISISLALHSSLLAFDQQSKLLSSRFGEVRLPSSWLQSGNVQERVDNWRRVVGSDIVVDGGVSERVSIKVYGLQTGETGLAHLRRLHASNELLSMVELDEANLSVRRGRLEREFFYGACRKQERSLFCIELRYSFASQQKVDGLLSAIVSSLRVY